jgi:deoxyhypusine synthase
VAPDTGGLSGGPFQEGKSWGKVQDAHNDMVTVYADATIAFPILALYVMSNQKSRKPKRLYKKLGTYYDNLKNGFFDNNEKYYDK